MLQPGEMLRDHLLEVKKIPAETRRRLNVDEVLSVSHSKRATLEAQGWEALKPGKRTVRVRRPKAHDVAFEDRVWAMAAKLHFSMLNADRSMTIQYGKGENERKQIDVFAADDEVVLVIECKSAKTLANATFKAELESIQGYRPGMIKRIRQEFPNHKIRFVFAASNFNVSRESRDRFEAADVTFMDEETIDYYLELAAHLGKAARYQLLGNLLAGTKIPEMDNRVAAIRGTMGGRRYYAFSIEPERLLKISYVLHRNQANNRLMPTYQRLIKKSRLKSVAEFVNGGGFFPNSVIVSIDSKKAMKFDLTTQELQGPRLGILHLPQTYRAAFVIDGQHRLYGYAGSERAKTELIPVVAFEGLPRPEQVRLFMQINEHQQAVPKNLRNTLDADMLWDSPDFLDQERAMSSRIAQHLGEEKSSPLFGRIIVGENKKNKLRCITIQAIKTGLKRGDFLGEFTKTAVKRPGTFYNYNKEETYENLVEFLELAFRSARENLESQWSIGGGEGGFVFINNGIEALTRIFSDVVDHCSGEGGVDPRNDRPEKVFDACQYYLDPLFDHLNDISVEQASEFKKMYGSGAGSRFWRYLQEVINEHRPEFDPPGLTEYKEDRLQRFNSEAQGYVHRIEDHLKKDVRDRLEARFGQQWYQSGVPKKVRLEAGTMCVEKNAELAPGEHELEPWDCLYLIHYKMIFEQDHALWNELFKEHYACPGTEKSAWKKQSDWLVHVNRVRNEVSHGQSVKPDDYEFLVEVDGWLIEREQD